jgi:hypothetical protein
MMSQYLKRVEIESTMKNQSMLDQSRSSKLNNFFSHQSLITQFDKKETAGGIKSSGQKSKK